MPLGDQGVIFLDHIYSQMNMHTCAKFGPIGQDVWHISHMLNV